MNKALKRALIAAAAAAVIAADTAIAYRMGALRAAEAMPAASNAVASEQADPLTRFRTEREQLRARQAAELNDIIHGEGTDAQTRALAQKQLMDLYASQSAEVTLEGILQARGFEHALVSVEGGYVNVLLRRREGVTQRESAVILELVMRETGVTGGNVKIIPVN